MVVGASESLLQRPRFRIPDADHAMVIGGNQTFSAECKDNRSKDIIVLVKRSVTSSVSFFLTAPLSETSLTWTSRC